MWTGLIILCVLRSAEPNPNELVGEILAKKCCAQGEYMLFDIKGVSTCKRLGGVAATIQLFERIGEILKRDPEELTDFDWIPQEFRTKEMSTLWVMYSQESLCPRSHALFIGSSEKHRYRIGEKGSLILKANSTGGHIVELPFSNREYCIDEAKGFKSSHVFMICPCERTRCIPKCCAIDRVLRFRGEVVECQKVTDLNWKPFPDDLVFEKDISYTVLDGQFPDCAYRVQQKEEMFWPEDYIHSWFSPSKGRLFENKDTCTDSLYDNVGPLTRTIASCASSPHVVGFIERRAYLHGVASVMMTISIFGLILHSLRSSVHLLSLCSYFVSLLFYHLVLVSILWPEEPLIPCSIVGYLLYYFTLSSALWLSIAAYNAAINSRDLINLLPEDQGKKCIRALCIFYSVYAWGIPAFFVAFTYYVQGTPALPQDALRPTVRTTRTCPDQTANVAKSDTFIYFSAPLTLLQIAITLLFTTSAVQMKILREMSSIILRPGYVPERSFYARWRIIISLKLMVMVMVLEFVFELLEWANEDPANHIYEILTDFLEIARAAGILIYWGTKLVWKALKEFCGLHNLTVSREPSDDESVQIEAPEPPNVPTSTQSGQLQAAGGVASTSGVGMGSVSGSGSASAASVLQRPLTVVRSGLWKWKFPYPRRRSQSPAGVTVASFSEAPSAGQSTSRTPDTLAPARRASQISITSPIAGPSQLLTSFPRAGPSGLSSKSPRAGPSGLSSKSPRAGPSGISSKSPRAGPSGLSSKSPRAGPSGLSSKSPRAGSSGLSSKSPSAGPSGLTSKPPRAGPSRLSNSPPRAGPSRLPTTPPPTGLSQPSTSPASSGSSQLSSKYSRGGSSSLSTPPPRADSSTLSTSPPRRGSMRLTPTPPSTGPSQSKTSPAHVSLSPQPATTLQRTSSATSLPARASPVRALFGRTSPACTSAGSSSSSSSPSSTPPRSAVQLISLNPGGPSEDFIKREQESSL